MYVWWVQPVPSVCYSFNLYEYLGKTALLPVLPLITPLMIYERQFSDYTQSGLAEVSKTGPSRIYVVDPWSQIGCRSLY